MCGQRAKPVWDGPHGAPGSPLPQDRGQLGQATRHRLVLLSMALSRCAALEAAQVQSDVSERLPVPSVSGSISDH